MAEALSAQAEADLEPPCGGGAARRREQVAGEAEGNGDLVVAGIPRGPLLGRQEYPGGRGADRSPSERRCGCGGGAVPHWLRGNGRPRGALRPTGHGRAVDASAAEDRCAAAATEAAAAAGAAARRIERRGGLEALFGEWPACCARMLGSAADFGEPDSGRLTEQAMRELLVAARAALWEDRQACTLALILSNAPMTAKAAAALDEAVPGRVG